MIKTVNRGDKLEAGWANSVAQALNNSSGSGSGGNQRNKLTYSPFSPIALWCDGDYWKFKIQPGFYYFSDQKTSIIYGSTPLEDFPEIEMISTPENPKVLVFNYETKKLGWAAADAPGNLLVLEFPFVDDRFTIKNRLERHIDLRLAPPFTPLLCGDGMGGLTIGATPGYVCERIPTNSSGNAVSNHFPTGLFEEGEIVFYPYFDDQQFSCVVNVDKDGRVTAPESGEKCFMAVESVNPTSIHYKPAVAEDEGHEGTYHYAIFAGGKILGGSHIDHFQDITKIINCGDPEPPLDNTARIVRDYDEEKAHYNLRRLDIKGGQMTLEEGDENISIGGNSQGGTFTVSQNGGAGISLGWSDGLVTTNGNQSINIVVPAAGTADGTLKYRIGDASTPTDLISWDNGLVQETADLEIPIPEIVAGDGISITKVANVYEVASTWPPDGWEELELYVCVDGVPALKTFLVKS